MDSARSVTDIAFMPAEPQPAPTISAPPFTGGRPPISFDRNELSGAFGDIGTDLPLLVGMVLASGLDVASVLVTFGAMQVATGWFYRMPMPVQPLKAVAVIVIATHPPAGVIHGGGLAIGLLMLLLASTGLLAWLARTVPHAVVRGLQFGLGLQLALLALRSYIPALGAAGALLAGISALVMLALIGNRRWPPAPFVVAIGIAYALTFAISPGEIASGFGFALPAWRPVSPAEMWSGFLLLAIPQVPLSLGNSVLATRQLAEDLFPDRAPLTVRRIGTTYAVMNIAAPFVGGVPTCHGSGGLAGHYALGGRTGGSVILYGAMFVVLGVWFSGSFAEVAQVFPLPVLGVLLVVEGLALMVLLRDLPGRAPDGVPLAVLVGLAAVLLPYGYLIGMVGGTIGAALLRRRIR